MLPATITKIYQSFKEIKHMAVAPGRKNVVLPPVEP
jgi:hypothetical protein